MTFPIIPAGESVSVDVLIWVEARNRSTGATETMGLWTGLDAQDITIDGTARTYYGAGTVLSVEDIVSQAGTNVQYQQAGLNILTPEVEELIRGYDARQAPVEVHIRRLNAETNAVLSINRVFRGFLDQAKETRSQTTSGLVGEMASSARSLTRTIALYKSNASQQRAHSGDLFFQYAGVSGATNWWWGLERTGPQSGLTLAERLQK